MKRQRPEDALQRQIVEYLDRALGGCAWFCHIPNGGLRSKIEAAIMKGLGVKRGTPDLLLVDGGRALWLEVKAPNGKISSAQLQCHQRLRLARSSVAVVRSLEEVEIVLVEWCVPLRARLVGHAIQRVAAE